MVPAPFRVIDRRQETVDTWTLELEPRLEFAPGQFTMLSAGGRGEVPISISGDPDGARLVHTVRAVGAATQAICEAEPGHVLGVRGPFGGTAWPTDAIEGADVMIVAGGVGLAPLRPAILHVLGRPERYGRVSILYGARDPDQLLFEDELARWAVEVTVDSAGAGWSGRVGVVTKLIERAPVDPATAVALLCGPEIMMRFAVPALAARGIAAERTYVSLERNMQCGLGHCGHCQLGPTLICRDGPVYRWSDVEPWLAVSEL
jgi:anaerobic sulfite reductase subunit B